MSQSRARSRSRRRRNIRPSGGSENVWLDRAWEFVTRPVLLGILLILTGIVCALAPSTAVPAVPSHGWWVAAFRLADASQGSITFLAMAAFSGVAMLSVAWRRRRGGGREALLPVVAVALMGAGILVGCLTWFAAQASLPTSRVALPPGPAIQAFPAVESGRAFEVMLPRMVSVVSVEPEFGKATVELREAGEEEGILNDIFVGDPLPIGDFRFALVGLEMDPTTLAAVMKAKDGISARATVGSDVRFLPDGPEYEVKQVVLNYQGVMGPAVLLESEAAGRFWVFQRDAATDNPLNDILVERIETSPVPVFSVSKTPTHQYAATGGLLFVLGFALLMFVGDRREDSIHEMGLVREEEQV